MAKQEAFTPEQIHAWQELLLPALKIYSKSEVKLAEETGLNQSTISELKRTPRVGMTYLSVTKIFASLGIEPNKVAEALQLWKPEDSAIDRELYVRVAAFNRLSKEKKEKVLWALDALLRE